MTAAYTRQLTSARLEVVSDVRARRLMRSALVAVLVALGIVAAARLLVDGTAAAGQRNELQQENTGLRTEVARLDAELQLERATRAALDEQVTDLRRQVADLERQLAFVNAQRTRPRAPGQSN
jgi:septal ring factor EnvC (AmiA/AmiB activator)